MKLLNYFYDAENVFKSTKKEIIDSNTVSNDIADIIISKRDIDKVNRYYKKVKENNIKV